MKCPTAKNPRTIFAALLCNLYWNAGPKHSHHSQTSLAHSPLNPFYTWCNLLLTVLHHSPVVSIPLILPYSPSYSSILFSHIPPYSPLRARELGAVIIMKKAITRKILELSYLMVACRMSEEAVECGFEVLFDSLIQDTGEYFLFCVSRPR